MKNLVQKFFTWPIWAYQYFISPWLGANCRYHPSCSQYAKSCFEQWPLNRAIIFSLRRILSCHPWSPGGHDPVPTPPQKLDLSLDDD